MSRNKALNFILLFSLFGCFLCLNSCKPKNNGEFEEISISVDSSRIGNEFVEMNLKFTFSPPKGWTLKPSELTEKIISRQNADKETGDGFIYKPLYIFFSDSTKGILTIGQINRNDTLKVPLQIQRYQDELIARFGRENVTIKNYIKDKIMISQLTIAKQSILNRKMIFKNIDGQYVQFDYTLQKDVFGMEEKAIESSLGTLKLVK